MSATQLGRLIANNDKIVAILACPTTFTDARPIEVDDPEWGEAMKNGGTIVDALNDNAALLVAAKHALEYFDNHPNAAYSNSMTANVSIHAPHMGSDRAFIALTNFQLFQSTLPTWGATAASER